MDGMKPKFKKAIFLLIVTIFSLLQQPVVLAEDKDDSNLKLNSKTQIQMQFKNENQNEDKDKKGNNEFEITGNIDAVSESNFVVSGQTIFIDPTHVNEFRQKGLISVGERVKVKGVLINGVKFAKDINVIGTGQGRFKFEVDSNTMAKGNTDNSNVKVEVKANGLINDIQNFLNQIMNWLNRFI